MSPSKHLTEFQLRGLEKAGDFFIPGDARFCGFSATHYIAEVDRVADYMTPQDRGGFKALLVVLALLPKCLLHPLLGLVTRSPRMTGFLGVAFRQILVGVKGVVMSLYYSDLTNDRRVFNQIKYHTHCGEKIEQSSSQQAFAQARDGMAFLCKLSVKERISYLSRLKSVILRRQDVILTEIQKATRKCRSDALISEIFSVLDHLDYLEKFAPKILADRKVFTPTALMGKKSCVYFEPLGTILVISPWNYPFYQAIVPITSALICGNTVVFKPSEHTPMTGVMESLLQEANIPSNWVQVVYGDGAIGEELIAQKPDKIFFTGSTRTGKRIMELASHNLTPVELELGGKDPMIVFADADLDRSSAGALWGGCTNAGQACTSVERLLVQDAVYDEFKKRLIQRANEVKIAVDSDGDSDYGAMTTEMQVRIVADHIDDALKQGATMLTGQAWDRKSSLIPPIILDQVKRSMKVISEETFGPILPLIPFKTEDEAIAIANDTRFGLSASVWTADFARATRVARAIHTGNVSINNVMLTEGNHALPFGGVGESGFGRYKGEFGLYAFSNIKSVLIDRDSKKIEANWYPYTARKYALFDRMTSAAYGKRGPWNFVRFALAGMKLENYSNKVKRGLR